MNWIKHTVFLLIGVTISTSISLVVLELIFGGWLRNDEWRATNSLNIIRSKKIVYSVDNLYGEDIPTVNYSRNRFGLRDNCASLATGLRGSSES